MIRNIHVWLCVLLFSFALTSCSTPEQKTTLNTKTKSTKSKKKESRNWEFYSWREDGQWFFALLAPSGKVKRLEDLNSVKMKGLSPLKERLDKLEAGDQVLWMPIGSEPFPAFTPEIRDELEEYCDKKSLNLRLIGKD